MLKRIYIDNYKSLVNFEVCLNEINLFLGINGAGKSAVFEILRKIKCLVAGDGKVIELFSFDNCTRWQSSLLQTFELDIAGNEGTYQYRLTIEHDDREEKARVNHESLHFDNKPLMAFEDGNAQLYSDNHSEGPQYPFDWSRSALASILPRSDNTKLTWFKEWMDHLVVIQIIPSLMIQDSPKEETQPSYYFENFVSWYRHVSQDQGLAFKLITELKKILPGFEYFKFEATGEKHRLLKAYFNSKGKNASVGYTFGELSDGQRMLIALYSLLHFSCSGTKFEYTLCLDEPENFLALPEIQPWLVSLYDHCMDGDVQTLLISHHPELINYLLASPVGYWFERHSNRPSRIKSITANKKDGIPISELVARGWLNE